MSDAPPIEVLPGISPATRSWLEEVGVCTIEDLQSLGSVEAYRRLRFMFPRRVSLNALYALEAALRGCHWLDLPQNVKTVLQQEARIIDEALRRGAAARCTIG
jgi:DNA transformation protein